MIDSISCDICADLIRFGSQQYSLRCRDIDEFVGNFKLIHKLYYKELNSNKLSNFSIQQVIFTIKVCKLAKRFPAKKFS